MRLSHTIILAALAFLYSSGCVLYYVLTNNIPPEPMLYPIAPGIWVGSQVDQHCGGLVWLDYAAGIITMTVIGAMLGLLLDLLPGIGHRSAS